MYKFQELYEKGEIIELLEFAKNSSTDMGKVWEIDALMLLGRYEETKLLLKQYYKTLTESKNPEIQFNFMLVRGNLCTDLGEIKNGQSYLEKALRIAVSHNLDNFYLYRGWVNLGLTYNASGDFVKAGECHKNAFKYTGGTKSRLATVNVVLGYANANNNNLKNAALYFDKGLRQSKEIQNTRMMSHALHGLINAYSWLRNFEIAKKYLEELEKLADGIDDYIIVGHYKFSKAIFLFNQPRLAIKMNSLQLFVDLLEEQLMAPSIELWVYWYLLELLFVEYRVYKQDTVFQEIKQYIDQYFATATKYSNIPHITISLITQAQLAGVEGEFDHAEKIVSEAIVTAEKFGATKFVERASIAKEKLIDEFKYMEVLIKQNTSLSDRLNKSNLVDYIKNAQDLIGSPLSNE